MKLNAILVYCSDHSIRIGVNGYIKMDNQTLPTSFIFESAILDIYAPKVNNWGYEFNYETSEHLIEIETVDIFNQKTIFKFLVLQKGEGHD